MAPSTGIGRVFNSDHSACSFDILFAYDGKFVESRSNGLFSLLLLLEVLGVVSLDRVNRYFVIAGIMQAIKIHLKKKNDEIK